MQNLDQELRVDNLVTPQDISASATPAKTNSGMWRSMAKYRKGLVVVTGHFATSDNAAVATLQCASTSGGSASANVSASVKTCTLTGTTAAPEQVGTIEFDVNDLTAIAATKYFVGVSIKVDTDNDDVGAVLVRGAARYYQGSSMPV